METASWNPAASSPTVFSSLPASPPGWTGSRFTIFNLDWPDKIFCEAVSHKYGAVSKLYLVWRHLQSLAVRHNSIAALLGSIVTVLSGVPSDYHDQRIVHGTLSILFHAPCRVTSSLQSTVSTSNRDVHLRHEDVEREEMNTPISF